MPPKAAKKEESKKKEEPKKEEPKKEEPPKQEEVKQQKAKSPEKKEEEEAQEVEEVVDEETAKKKKQAEMFKKYLENTGIAMAFQVIFAEILDKKVDEQKVFTYTASRLRQIGEDLEKIKLSKK